MDIISVLTLFGGIGLFLYGMDYLSSAMKLMAGAKLETILEKLTNNKFKGLALGTGVTAIIQSSTATAVIVLGFVNAGIMTLAQAVPVLFGSNVGSTMTSQLLRLGDIGSQSLVLTLLKPAAFAPVLVILGVIFHMFMKKRKFDMAGRIMLGLGILFVGMTTMEGAVAPLKESAAFQKLFTMFENPFLGILVGILITAIVQSSSASVGILQALTATGTITWGMAIPIIIGENIGKCMPVFISSLGASRDAKKVPVVHLIFNLVGALIWGGLIYILKAVQDFPFWESVVNRGNIADFHTLFNIATAFILMPFTGLMVKLLNRLIPRTEEEEWATKRFESLSGMFLKTPALALEQSRRLVCDMGDMTRANFAKVRQLLDGYDDKIVREMNTNEDFLDRAETKVSEYLVRVTESRLELKSTRLANELLRSVTDFERIGDYCIGIAQVFEFNEANGVTFSEGAKAEIRTMFDAVDNILKTTVDAYKHENQMIASRVEPLEEVIDSMRLIMEDHHIERLQNNECSVQSGISLKEILNSTDRIAGHCVNISVFLVQRLNDPHKFDAHQHLMQDHQEMTEEYHGLYSYYEDQYLEPLRIAAAEEKKVREEVAAEQLIEQIEALAPEETKSKAKDESKKKEKSKKKDKEKDVKKDKKKNKGGKNEK